MTLTTNEPAPLFNLHDVNDRPVNLESRRDRRVLIAFFRHAGCPFCNLRVHNLQKAHLELQAAGLDMIFFFESKKQVILRSTFHEGVSPIPIISDPEKQWYGAYGLEESGYKSAISHLTSFIPTVIKAKARGLPVHMMKDGESISTMPAEFLVDRGLVIKKVHYSQHLNDRIDIEEILAFARTGKVVE